ncbi:MAG TPA: aminotransferase class IV [Opitutaceae bacterium]|jgi:branched-subunit amino acid aminotransferase/4-amino-4-deoxychorismate lyase|nr:aminotransferase class IV [Opitutaceae bacterium]
MSAPYIQANTNGRLHDAREPAISPLNRGFLYGDAIYEVWRTYHGVIFAWEEHWRRLERSAAALYLVLPFSAEQALVEIKRTVAAFFSAAGARPEVYIRLQVTRGDGRIGLDIALADRPDFTLLVQANPVWTPRQLTQGLDLSLATGLRRNPVASLSPAWKTGNYLNNILCLREARSRGADEVVIINLAGEVTEAAVSNIAFVRAGEIVTPPMEAGILGGITRQLLLEKIAPAASVPVREATVQPDDFVHMEECFLLSTTKDVSAVATIDAVRFKVNDDTITMRLKRAFADYARSYAGAHPGLSVA